MTIQIEILNPEARGILEELAKLNLIKIKNTQDFNLFINLLEKIRSSSEEAINIEELTSEVEEVRTQRYKRKQE